MFTKTQLKLTLLYSLLFLSLFWLFSFGLYFWMENSLGEGYISRVRERRTQQGQFEGEYSGRETAIATIAGEVALNQLAGILIGINTTTFLVIPAVAWQLAKRSLAPIQTAHEKQRQFVSDASHELRTPLTIMSGEIDVALSKPRPARQYRRVLKSTREELARLGSLVENLLFLARQEQAVTTNLSEEVDMTDLLSSLVARLKPLYAKKQLAVSLRPPQENITVPGNTRLLRQLFLNLLDNAIKYTPKGKILVTLSDAGKQAKITVKDSGVGINPEDQTKIFDRFYRVDIARSETKGCGLGLAICQVVVKLHGGTITVASVLGKGSTFTVLLPAKPAV